MSTPVTIYEDNAGGLWLRAEDGTVAYEGGHWSCPSPECDGVACGLGHDHDAVTDEVAFVREHPNGDTTGTWSCPTPECGEAACGLGHDHWTAPQLPWTDDLDTQWNTISIETDQATGPYRLDRPGIAGRAYLGLPKDE